MCNSRSCMFKYTTCKICTFKIFNNITYSLSSITISTNITLHQKNHHHWKQIPYHSPFVKQIKIYVFWIYRMHNLKVKFLMQFDPLCNFLCLCCVYWAYKPIFANLSLSLLWFPISSVDFLSKWIKYSISFYRHTLSTNIINKVIVLFSIQLYKNWT